jgi:hypothetical protein
VNELQNGHFQMDAGLAGLAHSELRLADDVKHAHQITG